MNLKKGHVAQGILTSKKLRRSVVTIDPMLDLINRLLKFLIARLAGYSSASVRWSLVLILGLSSTVQIIKDLDHTLINSSYDKLLELRLYSPKVDPSILVLDID